ncbi:MAG: maturase [Chloroflexi bacterium]|nr:maturase [Chloroflexota bacterium]
MQTAQQILTAIRKMGEKDIPLTRVYRSLYSEDLFLTAYSHLYSKSGALTPGTIDDTVDGMNLERIRAIIEALRHEQFHFQPVRRTYIDKPNGGQRPLGIPNFSDKLVQEALRMLLEAYYEPRFRESSHSFRPKRGCHTALKHIKQKFPGTVWFIEGDIRACFDHIDHDILLAILARDIHDGRVLELVRRCLKAGVLEDWKYHATHSGTPQGGVLSPLLANIYLHELDTFVEDTLIPQYTKGKMRAGNPDYQRIHSRLWKARQRQQTDRVRELQAQVRELPSGDPHDPNYRRLKYVRYADDFLLGFLGSKAEAEAIKTALAGFLHDQLGLELNTDKTLITHARTQQAHFLNYAISTQHENSKITRNSKGFKGRSANGNIRLGLPQNLMQQQAKRYLRDGKIVGDGTLLHYSDAHIIETYQQRFSGIAEYYKYATNRSQLNRLQYIMQQSLVKTLASKFKLSAKQVYKKYSGRKVVDHHLYRTLQVEIPTGEASRLIYWGAIPLRVVPIGMKTINDQPKFEGALAKTDLIQRLQANRCELCGSTTDVEVHHIRKLADLKRRWAGRKEKPAWVTKMIAIQRKSLIVCRSCHLAIHAGQPTPNLHE